MIKQLLKLSPLIQFIILSSLLITLLILSTDFLLTTINTFLSLDNNPLTLETLSQIIPIWQLACIIGFALLFSAITLGQHLYQQKELKLSLKNSLEEKKIAENFEHLFNGNNFISIQKNIEDVLNLYKNFDSMKSTKIHLEMTTLKILIGHLDAGIIFVNHDKIVTHINPASENMLTLIPGEIIGQNFSRKIHNPIILDALEQCLHEDKKTINEPFQNGNNIPLLFSSIPIKDKNGKILRALIIIKKTLPQATNQNNHE
ncbi:MAG: PAS domain-containing protein [bacterium]